MQASQYRKRIRSKAAELLKSQEQLAYRNVNWLLGSPYFTFLGWGHGLPFAKAGYLILAWYLDGNVRCRDAALLCFDWMMGANPMGRSMTTGLGHVYPIRLLSLPMQAWDDRLHDPIPGITPYTFSGQNNYSAATMIYSYIYKPREDHAFRGCNVNLLPKSIGQGKLLTDSECYALIRPVIPLWRSFANLEGYAVNQNEFTVWETMAPAAAGYGALLQPGWTPPKDWKTRKPADRVEDLSGYIFLP